MNNRGQRRLELVELVMWHKVFKTCCDWRVFLHLSGPSSEMPCRLSQGFLLVEEDEN